MRFWSVRVAALVTGLVVLAGCTPTPAPAPTGSAEASPGPVVLDVPETRLALTCDEAAPQVARQNLLGAVVPLSYGSGEPFRHVGDVITLQAGLLDCYWGGPQGPSFRFTATPDGRDLYETWTEYIVPSPYYEIDTHGDRSVTYCGYGQCFFYLLVGHHAIEGVASRPDLMDEAELRPLFTPVIDALAAAARAALPEDREPWTAPTGTAPPLGACVAGNATMAAIAEAVGRPGSVVVGVESSLSDPAITVGADTCNLGATGYDDVFMGVTYVPSAAWAMPMLIENPPADPFGLTYEVVAVDDLASILVGQHQGYSTWGIAEAGGGLVSVWSAGNMSPVEFAAFVRNVAAPLAEG
jgi:hypothetical protein